MAKPLCFVSQRMYDLWRLAARGVKGDPNDYCYDCNPEHQSAMIRAFKCDYPGVTFHEGVDGEIHGLRPGASSMGGAPIKEKEEAHA